MAEIAVIEKAPGYRLDHPDFGAVCGITFAKGVIKEVKKTADDPIKITAKAKVDIEGFGISDFIPIFFRPKKQYWDTQEHQAQDINKGEKLYENAWMSFRSDDEVKVMLSDGKPVAIVAFLDGVPRIGEDIFKIQVTTHNNETRKIFIQCSKDGVKYDSENGPDGIALKLIQEALNICDTGDIEEVLPEVCVNTAGYPVPPAPGPIWQCTITHVFRRFQEWLIEVGGKLFILQTLRTDVHTYLSYNLYPSPPVGWLNWIRSTLWFSVLAAPSSTKNRETAINTGQQHAGMNPKTIDYDNWHDEGDRGYWLNFNGFTYQNNFTVNLCTNSDLNTNGGEDGNDAVNHDSILIHHRPHTKAELQAAGMWPGDN